MNLHNLPFSHQAHPLIYYQGTFDPAHEGHRSALQEAITGLNAVGAVVVVDDEVNPYKPERSPWKARQQIAVATFSDLNNVCVSDLSKEETKKCLINAYLIILIGSDIWPRYAQREKIPFQGLCISLREGEKVNYPSSIGGKRIHLVSPSIQDCSSTKIRHYLRSHPECYECSEPVSSAIALNPEALKYIRATRLYYRSREEHLKMVKEEIEKYVQEQLFPGKECALTCLTSFLSEEMKYGGKSGDLTFLASCHEKKWFIKGYARSTHCEDAKNEWGGIELFNQLSLSCSAATPLYDKEIREDYSFAVFSFLEECDLARFIKRLHSEELISKFIDRCFSLGRALAELHQKTAHPIQFERMMQETTLLNARALKHLKLLPQEKQDYFQTLFSSSCHAFMQNPGVHTYAHGDANLSNFIVDDKGMVYMLDLDHFFC